MVDFVNVYYFEAVYEKIYVISSVYLDLSEKNRLENYFVERNFLKILCFQ